MPVIFSADDIDYLVVTFSLQQLKYELHQAEILTSVASYAGDADAFYWQDFAEACRLAKDIAESHKTQPKPVHGRVDAATLKANIDIVAVVERYTDLRQSGGRFTGRCPLHEDKHPSFFIYPSEQRWHCFQCNQGGDVIAFIQAVEHTDFKGALSILRDR